MFESPRRLHVASILISGLAYLRHGVWPLILTVMTSTKSGESKIMLILVVGGAVVGLLGFVAPVFSYFFTNYRISEDSLIVNSGFIWRRTRVIPLARIQNVNTRQNLLHRLMGAAAVMVETAAGHGVEAELAAVSRADSIELQNALLQRKSKSEQPATEAEPPALFQLTPKQLFVAGALSNRLMYIVAGIAGVFQFDEVVDRFIDPIEKLAHRLSPVQAVLLSIASFFALFLVGWLLSVIYSLSRFYGFRMERHPKGLKLTYGLFTKIQSVVPLGRVQSLRIAQPLLYQPFGYCEMFADTAGSFDAKELGATNKLCPLASVEQIDGIGQLVFPQFHFMHFQWRRVSPKAVLRYAIRNVLAFLFLFGMACIPARSAWPLIGMVVAAPLSYMLAVLRYRYVGYAEQDGFLAARQGIFRKQVAVVPLDRTQILFVNQSWFQRRWRLADLALTTSSPFGVLHIENLDLDLAYSMQDRLSIESQNRRMAWRGGN